MSRPKPRRGDGLPCHVVAVRTSGAACGEPYAVPLVGEPFMDMHAPHLPAGFCEPCLRAIAARVEQPTLFKETNP